MGVVGGGRWTAIAATVVVAAGIYAAGNVLGRVTDHALEGEPVTEAVTPTPVPAAAPAEPGLVESGHTAAEHGGGTESTAPAVVAQPITGPGQPPLPMDGDGPYGSLRQTGADYAALTFDDGPDPRWTPEVLELLRQHSVKATFCVLGSLTEAYPELVRDIVNDGHTLCNHTWSHDVGLGSRPESAIRSDLERTNDAIAKAAPGARISYYRQPGGAWTSQVVAVAEELGMSSLHWDVDPQDWRKPSAGSISSTVSAGTGAGAIVLLHDGGGERHSTVKALGSFLPELASRVRLAAFPPGIEAPRRHGYELPLKPSQS